MGRRGIVIGTCVAVVVGGAAVAGVALTRHRDVAHAASVDGALQRFRDSAATSSGTTMPPGVYTYATSGSESVSALGGATHRYPATSTLTVTAGSCAGGSQLRWDVLEHRWTSWSVCPSAGGLRLSAWSEHHQFYGQDDGTDWTCPAGSWSPAGSSADLLLSCRSSDTTESGTTVVEAPETLLVGTTRVPTLHLRTSAHEAGGARGTVVEDRWLEERTGLPVRLSSSVRTANSSPVGDVTYTETYDLHLTSLEPRR